jgi:hypothetical protein
MSLSVNGVTEGCSEENSREEGNLVFDRTAGATKVWRGTLRDARQAVQDGRWKQGSSATASTLGQLGISIARLRNVPARIKAFSSQMPIETLRLFSTLQRPFLLQTNFQSPLSSRSVVLFLCKASFVAPLAAVLRPALLLLLLSAAEKSTRYVPEKSTDFVSVATLEPILEGLLFSLELPKNLGGYPFLKRNYKHMTLFKY